MAATIFTSLLVHFPLSGIIIVAASFLTGHELSLSMPDRHRFCIGCPKPDNCNLMTIRVT